MEFVEVVKVGKTERTRAFKGEYDEISDLLAELFEYDMQIEDLKNQNDNWRF